MAKYIRYQWAVSGDTSAVPDLTQSDGSVSYQTGYGAHYAIAYGSPGYKAIERTKLNGALNDITGVLQQYQGNGFPDFITSAQNGGTPYSYPINAMVRYDDGSGIKIYQSLIAINTDLPTVTTSWKVNPVGFDLATTIHAATSKTTPIDADELPIADSATSFSLKKLTWANLKTALMSFLSTNNQSFSAYASSVQTLTSGVATKIIFGTKEFDYANKFDNITNYRFQPSVAGLYLIESAVRVTSSATITQASNTIYKNGSGVKEGDFAISTTTTISRPRVSALIELNGTTDYVEIYPAFTSSGTISVTVGAPSTYFQATLIRGGLS